MDHDGWYHGDSNGNVHGCSIERIRVYLRGGIDRIDASMSWWTFASGAA